MTTDLRDLYQQVILDHQRSPRNFRVIPQADRITKGHNPLCGDQVTIYLKLEAGKVADVSFQGVGCAISVSSASMMTERIKGKSVDEVRLLFRSFHKLLTGTDRRLVSAGGTDGLDLLGKLEVFAGVREYPIRVKCATLPWHALHAAIEGSEATVSTELHE
ncbi:MAG: SUF system NifU family Fe-S cluster assembly protein [Planctomycetes bacterium RBG_16_64_12]|nr:MAG: SUF system NifU family Fe-S cluster assembly protein [Planctomycetes bacterium RBG_16_64_12]